MKGGITSGVVYPAAVVALARQYRFRNIGGTSAGAIAAVVTAAAEHGRRTNQGSAFAGLAALPAWLSAPGRLLGLFRPNASTRPIFALLMRVLASPQGQNKLYAAFIAVLSWNLTATAVAAIPGLLLIAYGILRAHETAIALGIVAAVVIPLFISLVRLFDCLANKVPENLYGICTGLDDTNAEDGTVLTSWLTTLIDTIAGVASRNEPLTFGDLWGTGPEMRAASPMSDADQTVYDRDRERQARDINLEVITTNLTHGRPYRFPFETNLFYFDPAEFRKLFPARVVDHMVAKSRQPTGVTESARADEAARMKSALPRIPLPEAADLPIVVAARMSLSFPLLISAVPLWAVDWSLPRNQQNRTAPLFEQCWFSDGGLSSNFPIHLFDSPIPTRPTFAIDLDAFPLFQPEDPQNESNNVWMPNDNHGGITETWTRFGNAKPDLGGFFSAIFNAMQNWQDNTQSRVPGFRDRIVHVYLSEKEGGMNLNMSSELLTKLAARGTAAGARLIANFNTPNPSSCADHAIQPTNWDNHRVVRYRTSMALLENWIRRFCGAYTPDYATLATRTTGTPPCSYPWQDADQQSYATTATADLCAMNARWAATGETFADGAPKPQPELVTRPRA
ncbi:MAG TPA: hypothetical protein VKR05_00685 [Candidatus Cybelea sp.]|nr:hypothetical protein [Candidatus Cybelea sp.]